MELDFSTPATGMNARRANVSNPPDPQFSTPEAGPAMSRIAEGTEYESPYKKQVDDLQKQVDELYQRRVVAPQSAPPATPISKVYKDFDAYVRERERINRTVTKLKAQFREAPRDVENLTELEKAMKRATPPQFLKNSWWTAAVENSSATTTTGDSVRFSKLMDDPAFAEYANLATDIVAGLEN